MTGRKGNGMTDDELTAWIAEHVMGWNVPVLRDMSGMIFWPGSPPPTGHRFFRPLDDWNDVMMIREPMRQKGFVSFALGDNIGGGVTASFFKQNAGVKNWYSHEFTPKDDRSDTAQRRAILLAAKGAIEVDKPAIMK